MLRVGAADSPGEISRLDNSTVVQSQEWFSSSTWMGRLVMFATRNT
jgi:hypothetical protein